MAGSVNLHDLARLSPEARRNLLKRSESDLGPFLDRVRPIIAAVKEVGLKVPLVVRLEGTNVDLGKDIIRKSGLNVIAADDLKDGAEKIVKAVRG